MQENDLCQAKDAPSALEGRAQSGGHDHESEAGRQAHAGAVGVMNEQAFTYEPLIMGADCALSRSLPFIGAPAGGVETPGRSVQEEDRMDVYGVLGWVVLSVVGLIAVAVGLVVIVLLVARWSQRSFHQEMERRGKEQ